MDAESQTHVSSPQEVKRLAEKRYPRSPSSPKENLPSPITGESPAKQKFRDAK